ncbi:MAG: aspartate aminotransferase [Thermosediminibacterales bacterium]|nr:aspartate aminotransferase [Thermosediminibacterales bacterium]MDK2835987.1 aspartate aminotransferase [Thermosediminibacterales bacterium]
MKISERAMGISPSLTLAITAKAKEMKKRGLNVIGFGAGEPDFDTPEHVKKTAIKSIEEGFTKYTPASGIVELKEAICNKLKKENNLNYTTDQILVSNGAKHSLFNAFLAILNPEDEVIVPAPYWVSYPELIKMAGGKPVFLETDEKNDFKIYPDDLKRCITSKTKAIVLNSPNNPTGSIYSYDELKKIAEIAVENKLFVISDEIYEKLVYDDSKHISIASLDDSIKEQTIVINGVSKAYSMTGWRIGYAAGPSNIIKAMSNIQSHSTSNPNSIAQRAAYTAISGSQTAVEKMVQEFEKRRNFMVDAINKIEGISCKKPQGAFYVMVNISDIKGKLLHGKKIEGSQDFASQLLDRAQVAVVPGIAFGADDYVRLSYATSMENIKEGIKRIESFLQE